MERRRPLGDSGIYSRPPISYPHPRENSFDHASRNMSPSPPQPPLFMMRPTPSFTHGPTNTHNDYQIQLKKVYSQGGEQSQVLMQLLQRVRQLEMKADQNRKVNFQMEMLQGKTSKLIQRVDLLENAKNEVRVEKENVKSRGNLHQKQSLLMAHYVTKEEMERQMKNLQGSFKSLIQGLKSSLTAEVKDMHGKQKKRMIEIVAGQLTTKMQDFKDQFKKECDQKLNNQAKSLPQNLLGISKDSLATAIILKQHIILADSGTEVASGQTKYYVDNWGWLMDENKCYIIDSKGLKIMLSDKHLQLLKKQGMMNGNSWVREDLPRIATLRT